MGQLYILLSTCLMIVLDKCIILHEIIWI